GGAAGPAGYRRDASEAARAGGGGLCAHRLPGGGVGRRPGREGMILWESPSTDPYFNLALEQTLFEGPGREAVCCMLWRNDRTIVVGKYQNVLQEVDLAYVRRNGIRVARRLSGGGAVYHDLGNVNFTFVAPHE